MRTSAESRRVSFPNSRGLQLAGRLDHPADGEVRAYALFAHCFTCGKDLKALYHMGKALALEGVASLRFDFTGVGESEGQFQDTDLDSNQDDLVSAARFLDRDYAPPQLLIGHSLGGAAVLLATPLIPTARAITLVGTPSDLRQLLRDVPAAAEAHAKGSPVAIRIGPEIYHIGPGFQASLLAHDLSRALDQLGLPLLILHATRDTLVDTVNAEALFRRARHPKSFCDLPGADHLLSSPGDAAYAAALIATWSRPFLGE